MNLLSKFPKGMSVRVSVPEDFDRFSPHSAYIANNLHVYGLIADDLWTDGTGHAVLQIPLCDNEDHNKFTFDGKMKHEVKPSKDDPEGEGTYF